jgi:hypothetical protein
MTTESVLVKWRGSATQLQESPSTLFSRIESTVPRSRASRPACRHTTVYDRRAKKEFVPVDTA